MGNGTTIQQLKKQEADAIKTVKDTLNGLKGIYSSMSLDTRKEMGIDWDAFLRNFGTIYGGTGSPPDKLPSSLANSTFGIRPGLAMFGASPWSIPGIFNEAARTKAVTITSQMKQYDSKLKDLQEAVKNLKTIKDQLIRVGFQETVTKDEFKDDPIKQREAGIQAVIDNNARDIGYKTLILIQYALELDKQITALQQSKSLTEADVSKLKELEAKQGQYYTRAAQYINSDGMTDVMFDRVMDAMSHIGPDEYPIIDLTAYIKAGRR